MKLLDVSVHDAHLHAERSGHVHLDTQVATTQVRTTNTPSLCGLFPVTPGQSPPSNDVDSLSNRPDKPGSSASVLAALPYC